MYLHCHACGWEQDDYWDEHYNPLRRLLDWEKTLLTATDLDAPIPHDQEHRTYREIIAQDMERKARVIRSMRYRTRAEYHEQNPERRCPACGVQRLDED